MQDFIILILVIILIYFIFKSNNYDERTKPMYFDLKIRDICSAVGSKDSSIDDKDAEAPNSEAKIESCKKKAIDKCTPKKSIEDQLYDQKKLYEDLKLKIADPNPTFRYSSDDRYLFDNGYNPTADDKLTIKMKDVGGKAQEATVARSMWSKNSLIPYLEEELEEHAGAYGWWDADEDLENEF